MSNLEIKTLKAAYGRRVVIQEVSLRLEPGEWYVLLGPNGCGKSTLLDCVAGKMIPERGDIGIAGQSLRERPYEAKRQLGYGCAPEHLPDLLTARQCLEIHAGAKELDSIGGEILALADELRFSPYLDSFVDTMSLGTRQKLSVLLALVGDPALLVLDEAFNGLDPASALVLKRHLRMRLDRDGAGLLLATHSLDIVEHHADRCGLLLDGKIKHEWGKEEIRAARVYGSSLESMLAAASAA